jgi:hypothetical protein
MPPLASTIVDPSAKALLTEWISSGAACKTPIASP